MHTQAEQQERTTTLELQLGHIRSEQRILKLSMHQHRSWQYHQSRSDATDPPHSQRRSYFGTVFARGTTRRQRGGHYVVLGSGAQETQESNSTRELTEIRYRSRHYRDEQVLSAIQILRSGEEHFKSTIYCSASMVYSKLRTLHGSTAKSYC